MSKDHGVSSDELDGFVVSGVDDEALGGSSGHDGARGLGHGSGELHDLSVPCLVRDVSLSVLGNSLLSGRSPGSESGDVSHALVVEGNGLEVTTGLAFLVSNDLSTSGVSGSAPELNNLTLGGETLLVSLLVGELVKEFLGSLAHLGVEHVSLHGSRESDVANKLSVKGSGFLGNNDDSVSSESGELSSLVSRDGVSDVHAGFVSGSSADLVVLGDNSVGNSSGGSTSGGVNSADGEFAGNFNSLASEGVSSLVEVVSLGVDSSASDLLVTVNDESGIAEVSGGELGVVREHSSLEVDLSSVFSSGEVNKLEGTSGSGLEDLSKAHLSSGVVEEVESEFLLLGDSNSDSVDSLDLVFDLKVDSTSLLVKSDGDGSVVDHSKLEGVGNSSEVNNLLVEFGVHDLSVTSDVRLVLEDFVLLDGDTSLLDGHSSVTDSDSSLSSSEGNSLSVSESVHLGFLLGSKSKGNLQFFESDGLVVSVDSELLSADRVESVLDSEFHVSSSDLGFADEHGLDSEGTDNLGFLGSVDSSPVVDSLVNGKDKLSDVSNTGSKSHPDGSKVFLLDDLDLVVLDSVSELDSELSNLLMSSLLGSGRGSLSKVADPDSKLMSGVDHELVGGGHGNVHTFSSVVGGVSLDGPSLGISDVGNLSSDGSSSLGEGDLFEVDGDFPGMDGTVSTVNSEASVSVGDNSSLVVHSVVGDHSVFVNLSLLHGGISDSHGSSSSSGDSSVVDHESVSLFGGGFSDLGVSEGNSLKTEGNHVFTVGNSSSSLGSQSEVSGSASLDVPGVDDSFVSSHRDLSSFLGVEFESEGLSGSSSGNSELGKRELESAHGSKSSSVHGSSSLLTTESLSVVVEGNSLGVFAGLSLLTESLLSSELDSEVVSHDSGSSGESGDSTGSGSFSSVLGLELTSSNELSVASGTDSSLLSAVCVSSGLNSEEVSSIGIFVSLHGLASSDESDVLSSVSASLGLFPCHHGSVFSPHDRDGLESLDLLGGSGFAGSEHLASVSNEDLDSKLHGFEHLSSEGLSSGSSLELDSEVSLGLVHHSHVLDLDRELVLEVSSVDDKSAVGVSHDDGHLSEVDLSVDNSSLDVSKSVSHGHPSGSPFTDVDLEATHLVLGVFISFSDLDHPGSLEVHLLAEMVLLGSLDVDGPLVVRFLVGVNSSVVSSDGGLEDSLGDSPVSVGSLHEGFHLVGLNSPRVHLDDHTLVSS